MALISNCLFGLQGVELLFMRPEKDCDDADVSDVIVNHNILCFFPLKKPQRSPYLRKLAVIVEGKCFSFTILAITAIGGLVAVFTCKAKLFNSDVLADTCPEGYVPLGIYWFTEVVEVAVTVRLQSVCDY